MENQLKINYGLASSEHEARNKGYHYLIENHIKPDVENGFEQVDQLMKLSESWRIVLIPKEKHPMIYPPGGFYTGGTPYVDSEDPFWGAYRVIPCIEVTDFEGTVIDYIAFEGLPDKCLHCQNNIGRTEIIPKCRGLFLCKKDGKMCAEKVMDGCDDFRDKTSPTEAGL